MNNIFAIVPKNLLDLPTYLCAVGGTDHQEDENRKNGYHHVHFLFSVSGSGRLRVASGEFNLNQHTLAILLPNEPHEYFALEKPWQTRWIVFSGKNIKELLKTFGWEKSGAFKLANNHFLLKTFNQLYSSGLRNYDPLKASAAVYSMLINASTNIRDYPMPQGFQQVNILSPVIEFIQEHYASPLSIEDLSSVINVTPQYLCRLFSNIHNMRPFEYLNMIRIKQAKELLCNTTLTVDQIASLCGFNSSSYFCRKFKADTGISPTKFSQGFL